MCLVCVVCSVILCNTKEQAPGWVSGSCRKTDSVCCSTGCWSLCITVRCCSLKRGWAYPLCTHQVWTAKKFAKEKVPVTEICFHSFIVLLRFLFNQSPVNKNFKYWVYCYKYLWIKWLLFYKVQQFWSRKQIHDEVHLHASLVN